jgi:hypothetical protein
VTGAGTAADPFTQVTSYDVRPGGTPVAGIVQTTRYVNGSQEFTISWAVTNVSGGPLAYKALAAADFFFAGSDRGTGIFTAGPPRFVGGTNSDSGSSGGLVEVVGTASPAWSTYQALEFGPGPEQVWGKIGAAASTTTPTFDGTVVAESVDDAGAVEWDQRLTQPLAGGATAVYSLVARSGVPSALQLNPTNAAARQGEPINITAIALDSNGQPYAGATLRFTILGANAQSGMHTLDASGSAVVVDPAANAGFDTVVIYVDFNGDDAREDVEPQATALTTIVDDVPPTCTLKVSGDRPGGGGAGKPLVITVACDTSVTVTVVTSLTPGSPTKGKNVPASLARRRKVISLAPVTMTLAPGASTPVDVAIPRKLARKYAGKRLTASVVVTATDDVGNSAIAQTTKTIRMAKRGKRR